MDNATKEQWMLLCERAAQEKDPTLLLELVREINQILQAKAARIEAVDPREDPQKS